MGLLFAPPYFVKALSVRWVGESIGWEPVGLRVSGGFGKSREKSQSHREVLDDLSVRKKDSAGKTFTAPSIPLLAWDGH